ncbi:MAG: YbjN domain-containing protein [Actinobacteria bacterium]|nr:YbjN domain-containing protein [Actinomycetota bacterium]
MTRAEVLRPFVEQTVAEYLGLEPRELQIWEDGTIPIRAGSSVVNVRLVDGARGHALLQVFAPMLHGIRKSTGLIEKLNEVNASLTFARAFWFEEQVILTMELLAESLDREQVSHAVSLVSLAADHWDGLLKKDFGGETAFPESSVQEAPATRSGVEIAGSTPSAPSSPGAAERPPAEEPPPAGYI